MKNIYNKKFDEDTKLLNAYSEIRVACKCSHTMSIRARDRVICSYCGNWVYRTPELEFKYKMVEKMKEMERNDKDEHTV